MSRIALEISAIAEYGHTGIAQVARRLAAEGLNRGDTSFVLGSQLVPDDVIADCVSERSGLPLQVAAASSQRWKSVRSLMTNSASITLLPNMPLPTYTSLSVQLVHDLVPRVVGSMTSSDQFRTEFLRLFGQRLASSDLVLCVSEATKRDVLMYYGLDKERVECVVNGPSAENSEGSVHFFGRPYLLVLGTCEPRKNLRQVLGAAGREPWILDHWDLVFVGKDGWGRTFEDLVREAGLSHDYQRGRVVRLPYVGEQSKWALLRGADALVFPSTFEGYGLPVAEALAVGTEVIASRSSSIVEAAGQGTGVTWIDPENGETLVAALKVLTRLRRQAAEQSGPSRGAARDDFAESVFSRLDRTLSHAAKGQA